MVKITLIFVVYCIGCVIGSFSNDVNGIGSSISSPVASASGIENAKSFSNDRAKRRALALLVPFDDYEESAEEHHKSKRCWRARPVRKMRLSLQPVDAENRINRESDRLAQGLKYNYNKPNDNEKRSAEQSEEESWENSQNWEDNSDRKFPSFKIVPLKNLRTNLKELLRADQETEDDNNSAENTEDLILKRIKDHLNSDDYNVLALVGKRASNPKSNRQGKFVCYCREANCSGGNSCQRTYRPCSRCENSRPVFVGKASSNRCLDGGRNYYTKQEVQSTDAKLPLTLQYPATKNEVIENPVDEDVQLKKNLGLSSSTNADFNKVDYSNLRQNLPVEENSRYQFSYNTPRIVLANPNNAMPLDEYRTLHNPISAKSGIQSQAGIPDSKIPNFYSSDSGNGYRYGNANFRPNYNPYNQWIASSHYPSIGKADNLEVQNKNYGTVPRNYNNIYKSSSPFIGSSNVEYANQRMIDFPQPETLGLQIGQTFGTIQPKITTNFHPISNDAVYNEYQNGDNLGWSTPNVIKTQTYPQQQHVQTLIGNPYYTKKPESPGIRAPAELYGENDHEMEDFEKQSSLFDFKAAEYDFSTENHFGSVPSLETNNHNWSDESQEDDSMNSNYEDGTEEEIINTGSSVVQDPADREHRGKVDGVIVNDEPQKYRIPLISVTQVNPSRVNELSDTSGVYQNFKSKNDEIHPSCAGNVAQGNRELYDHKNSEITGTEISGIPNHGDQTGDTIHETDFRTQLEEPTNTQSNLDQHNDDTTSQVIIEPESNEGGYSLSSESQEDVKLEAAQPKHSDMNKSGQMITTEDSDSQKLNNDDYSDIQVITNGYFTSQAYDDFGNINEEDIPVTEIGSGFDPTQHEDNTQNSNPNNPKQMDSGSQNEKATNTDSEAATGNHLGDRKLDSFIIHQSGDEDSDQLSMVSRNQLLEDDVTEISRTNPEREESLVGTTELKKPNVGCTCTKSNDVIETLKNPETSSIEVVGKQETASAEYESDTEDNYKYHSSIEEDATLTRSKEVAEEAVDDLPSLPAGREESGKSYEDVSYSENGSMEYSTEDGQKNSADEQVETENNSSPREHERDNYYDRVGNEPADFIVDNSPTRYFSPNDRVLEYVKKHSQNSVIHSDAGEHEQQRTQANPIYPTPSERETHYVTPTIYHTEIHRDQSAELGYQGFDSGSESEEITTESSKDGNDSQDDENGSSYERTASDVSASREFSGEVKEPLNQSPRYEDRVDMQLSNCGEYNAGIQSIVFEKPRDDNTVENSGKLKNKIDESDITEQRQTLVTTSTPEGNIQEMEPSREVSPEVDIIDDDKIYHDNISEDVDEYGKAYRGSEENRYSEESVSGNMQEVKHYQDISPERDVDDDDQIYHDNISEDVDKYAKEYRDPQENGFSDEHGSTLEREHNVRTNSDTKNTIADNQASLRTDESTEITSSYKNSGEKIHHLITSDDESSQVSTEDQGMKHPTEGSGEIYSNEEYYCSSSTESNEKSTPTQEPIDTSDDYSYSAESTEGSILVGKSPEQDVALSNEKSEIIHIHKSFPTYNYGYAESTERFESSGESIETSTDIGAKNLPMDKYSQYNEWDDAALATKTTLPCSHQVAVPKLEEENYDNNKKLLDITKIENHAGQSAPKNPKPEEPENVMEQPDLILQQTVEPEEENYSDISDNDSGVYTPDTERSSEVQNESTPETETKMGSSEVKNFEIVSGSHSRECCTKPPEVQDDAGYLGRLQPKKSNPEAKSLGDLVESDLYYIGDGVKLPLTIKRLKDGSFALSITDKICEQRSKEKCPCCVPREGRILQEKRGEEDSEESTGKNNSSSLHRRAIPDDEEIVLDNRKPLVDDGQGKEMSDPKLDGAKKAQHHVKRVARSISMPVDKFAEKYNLILDLNEQLANDLGDFGTAESFLRQNVSQRDTVTGEARKYLVQKLALIDQVPDDEKEGVLVSTLQDLIGTEPKEVFKAVNGMKENLQSLKSVEDGQKARYGYQRDNPILDRIKIIKQLQKETRRCEHKYQKDCDDAITQKTELLKMILYWLKDLVASKPIETKT